MVPEGEREERERERRERERERVVSSDNSESCHGVTIIL